MCKTLHYPWLVVMLVLGVVYPLNATQSPETLSLQPCSDCSNHTLSPIAGTTRKDQKPKFLLDPQLLDSVEAYLQVAHSPLYYSPTPCLFIDESKNKAGRSLIRNGDLEGLEVAFLAYQSDLTNLRTFSRIHMIPPQATRRAHSRSSKVKQINWNSFRKLQKQLWASFQDFRLALLLAHQTEQLIWAQYRHNPMLYQAVNSLINLNGKPLPVYVYTRHTLFHEDPELQHLAGMLVVSLQEGAFSSDTPVIRSCHPEFVGKSGALAVFVDSEADGATLSHEFGHLYYLYHHWEPYMKFIALQGEHYQIGGHGLGDNSGRAANLAEEGKMPDVHMPWTYRKQWSEVAQLLMTLAGK